jgi:hypothetical protein
MKKLIFLLIALLIMPSIALAAKGATKPDYQALIDAEAVAREAADTALQQQIDEIQPPPTPVCGLTGVWAGNMEVVLFGDGPTLHLEWIGSHTSMDGLKGEMLLNWTYNNGGENPNFEMLLPGTGVWELIDSDTGTYSFTWYSQITSDGWSGCTQYRGVRVSGTAQINNCNEVIMNYLFDMEYETTECELIWDSSPAEGTAYEYRMPNIYTPPAAQ